MLTGRFAPKRTASRSENLALSWCPQKADQGPSTMQTDDRLYLAWSVESLHSLLAYSCTKTQVNTGVSARSAYVRTNFPCLKETFCTASPFRSIGHLVPHLGCSAHRPVHAVSVSCYTALCTGTGCAGRNPYRYRLCGYTGSW